MKNNIFVKMLLVTVTTLLLNCYSEKMPKKWKNLGVPTADIVKVYEKSDDNGLFVDYVQGTSYQKIFNQIDSAFIHAGYQATCNEFDGFVKGYSSSKENLVVKIDLLDITALSIFNDKAGDKLLYGLCFKGYRLGSPQKIRE